MLQLTLPSISSTDAYGQALTSKVGFGVIQVIGNEVISAGNSTVEQGVKALIHCRVDAGGKLSFTLKSSSMTVLQQLETQLLPSMGQTGGAPAPQTDAFAGLF